MPWRRRARAIARAGGEAIGAVYDGEPGIDRAALVRGPGGHVYKLFCGMETVAAPPAGDRPTRFEHASVKARNLGPTERFLARRASASPSPTAWAGPRAGGTATPTTTGWR